ncbi:hypothetical protein J4221_04155 [Candidatus Pacearchaeota archaeon]|nr:hypothetical protein [Candidatus Pacearchaeota archaeon]
MDTKKIVLITSILGIFLLLSISYFSSPRLIQISEINAEYLNKKVRIQGTIISIKNYDNFQILTIEENNNIIDVVVDEKQNISKNQNIGVIGKVSIYKENIQINAEIISSTYPSPG